jgi:WD40 repeat protein
MTRSRRSTAPAIGVVLLTTVGAFAFPIPKPAGPPLPEGAVRRFGRPDVSAGQTVRAESQAQRVLQGSNGITGSAIAPTPDGRHLIVADVTGRIDIFDLAMGPLDRRLQAPKAEGIHSIAVSPNGRWLACGRVRGDLQLWDLTTGKPEGIFPVRARVDGDGRGLIERIAFGPDSKVLYTGVDSFSSVGNRGTTAWEVPTGKRLWNTLEVGYNLAADPRGRWVLTGLIQQDPPRLALLDAATGRVARSMVIEPSWDTSEGGGMQQDASWTLDRLFTSDGSRLMTIHGDGTVRIWDPDVSKELVRMKWGSARTSEPGGLACSPDGRWIAVRDGATIQIWEAASGRQVLTIRGLEAVPRELAFTRDGRGLITSSGPAPILWSLRPKDLPRVDGPADMVWEALASADALAAYRLVWALAENPKVAVTLLAARVRPADLVLDRGRFDRLVTELDSPEYVARERAERSLTAAGFTAPGGWIRQALDDARSEEVRTRLGRVMAVRDTLNPTRWRLERAVQVLEMAGTDEATKLLKAWAAGPPGGFLTQVAAVATGRIAVHK